jgi:hypothetical protein
MSADETKRWNNQPGGMDEDVPFLSIQWIIMYLDPQGRFREGPQE